MLVGGLACCLKCSVMLADGMVVGRLVVMMGRGTVVSGGMMMMVLGGGDWRTFRPYSFSWLSVVGAH